MRDLPQNLIRGALNYSRRGAPPAREVSVRLRSFKDPRCIASWPGTSWSRSHVWLYSGHDGKSEISLSLAFRNSFNSEPPGACSRPALAHNIDCITELKPEFSDYFREFGKYLALRIFIA